MWSVEFVSDAAVAEVQSLPLDMRAKFDRIVGLIEKLGLQNVGEPHLKHVEGKLWEIRMRGRDGIARSLYMTASGQQVLILRTFVKKTQQTPRREIELALERAVKPS